MSLLNGTYYDSIANGHDSWRISELEYPAERDGLRTGMAGWRGVFAGVAEGLGGGGKRYV